ncbi:hypothetical protein BV22DRAFT_834973 [Leucogyrophana mollusca]|uniref:Uncharacterized protein n=1 Tax=Leucogyrophana mollusca TaxID=85980 RepID=A0ACB8B507_9AGAM|nr:hypothetical protein BV22DRAFT_834973 [Leucogyrophana mollusca]
MLKLGAKKATNKSPLARCYALNEPTPVHRRQLEGTSVGATISHMQPLPRTNQIHLRAASASEDGTLAISGPSTNIMSEHRRRPTSSRSFVLSAQCTSPLVGTKGQVPSRLRGSPVADLKSI